VNYDREKLDSEINKFPNETRMPNELDRKILYAITNPKNDKEPGQLKGSRFRFSRIVPVLAMVACLIILIPLGFYQLRHTSSVQGNTESNNVKTIQTFLKVEITGPNEEFKKAFDQTSNQGPDFALMNAYNKKYYSPLLSKDYYQQFINDRYETMFLEPAYEQGYQFKVKNIEIKKQKDDYNWSADVDYTKDGKTKTSTVNGIISLNDNGKIIYIRFIDGDNGIMKILTGGSQPKNKTS
jgi:hypothetical protein